MPMSTIEDYQQWMEYQRQGGQLPFSGWYLSGRPPAQGMATPPQGAWGTQGMGQQMDRITPQPYAQQVGMERITPQPYAQQLGQQRESLWPGTWAGAQSIGGAQQIDRITPQSPSPRKISEFKR